MNTSLGALGVLIGIPSMIGGSIIAFSPGLSFSPDDAKEELLAVLLGASTASSGTFLVSNASTEAQLTTYNENLDVTTAYIQSLSKEELEQLSEEITYVVAKGNVPKSQQLPEQTITLNEQMDLVEEAEIKGEIDENISKDKREEILIEYIYSLSPKDLNNIYYYADIDEKSIKKDAGKRLELKMQKS